MAAHLMLQQTKNDREYQQLHAELTGPRRTGRAAKVTDTNAPAWWHGDEEAFETVMAATARLPRRRR